MFISPKHPSCRCSMARRGIKPAPRPCDMCGEIYIQNSPKQVRCAKCQKKYSVERAKQKADENLKKRDYKAWLIKHDKNICKKIKSCAYGHLVGGLWLCDYMAITGKRRQCPVKDCKEFKRKHENEIKNIVCHSDDIAVGEYSYSGLFDIEQEVRL